MCADLRASSSANGSSRSKTGATAWASRSVSHSSNRSAIAADHAAGRRPLIVIANAGSTAAGANDPFAALSEICREHGIWLHVDGAYGGFACLSERGSAALEGMALADSPQKFPSAVVIGDGTGPAQAVFHTGVPPGA